MVEDYRNTEYCCKLEDLSNKKQSVVEEIKKDHPRAIDMHAYISKNEDRYKAIFMKSYNYKCAYCGVSIDLVPKVLFEIDHFLYEKSARFASKKDAGYIENLVFACHDCNHNKSSLEIPDEEYDTLHPDKFRIKDVFYRDENYCIKIAESYEENVNVEKFYYQLKLNNEIHRIDYLLMNLIGLLPKLERDYQLYIKVSTFVNDLRRKRNLH